MEAPTQSLPPFLFRVYIPEEHFPPVSTRYCCLLFLACRSSLAIKVDKSYVLMALCTPNSGKGVTSAVDYTMDWTSLFLSVFIKIKLLVLFILSSFRIFSCAIFANIKLNVII